MNAINNQILATRIVDVISSEDMELLANEHCIIPINRKQIKDDGGYIGKRYDELRKKNGYLEAMRIARIEFVEKLLNEK